MGQLAGTIGGLWGGRIRGKQGPWWCWWGIGGSGGLVGSAREAGGMGAGGIQPP